MKMRSWLCASPLNTGLVKKCEDYCADVIHFDLEDAVPVERKACARTALKQCFPLGHPLPVAVRINSVASGDGLKDLLYLTDNTLQPAIIIIPKANIARDVSLVSAICPASQLFVVIENLDSFFELRQLSTAPAGLTGVIFGAADFAVNMGADPQQAAPQLIPIKAEISLCARRLQLLAIDSPCFSLHQQTLLQKEIALGRQYGFSGKIAIHPGQVTLINQGFSVGNARLARARRLITAFDHAAGVTTEAGNLLGPPHLKYARSILASK